MKIKIYFVVLLATICLLTACPAPESDHVIINETDSILEVEYEYVLPLRREDSSQLGAPAKMSLEQYENKNAENSWSALTAPNEFSAEPDGQKTAVSSANDKVEQNITKVKLKLLPKEVLRVFVSGHINADIKNVERISLRGEKGKLEIEGAGFEQFADYRPDRFFTDTVDYRIVYH